ncbi:MAG: hypothetical protein JNK67_10430 [Alphaproteobacteria bacterium]|nr:hypothetical protein [Alphaproteobacteria bacterium]
MDERRPTSSTPRPTVEEVERFARRMRARSWSQYVIDPARRAGAHLWRRLHRAPHADVPVEPDRLPEAPAMR